ncbi:MAG: N-acetyl-gamma-glutamyl-phosphate reductase [Candidatus Omnitrophica bacterium]|nr:N-acetyl-gamma-glutamyl-phosphate reductase [Candidatus Omnitrophota bacterium]MBU2473328.1 N-acetyl-gamma-glutamyl-phosphate reductase [Candidatus Omnitrophota bacterium]
MKVAVLGATGFTGETLIEILLRHPKVKISYLCAKIDKPQKFSKIFPHFKGRLDLICANPDLEKAAKLAETIFLALPHRVSQSFAPFFVSKGKLVIDLSADYRFKKVKVYEQFYQTKHQDLANLKQAVYGLPEFYKPKIKKAKLIANPGCYPTVSILSLAPLLKVGLIKNVIIDAKSGVSGAGRNPDLSYRYEYKDGNCFSYKPFEHQHLPEIVQVLSQISGRKVSLRFTPHVIPAKVGILATIYGDLTKKVSESKVNSLYEKCYKKAPFVRLLKRKLPQLKEVVGTNFCDIGFQIKDKKIVIVGAIDNLIKGAAGQAVQNMNIILGYPETAGLL